MLPWRAKLLFLSIKYANFVAFVAAVASLILNSLINSLVKQVLEFPFFSLSYFVVQSHVHLNRGSLSFFGGLVFKRLFSVRDNY